MDSKIHRKDTCPACGTDLHVCFNCQHYDVSAYHECRESSAEYVSEKGRSNFCEYFSAQVVQSVSPISAPPHTDRDELMKKAESLFKKSDDD